MKRRHSRSSSQGRLSLNSSDNNIEEDSDVEEEEFSDEGPRNKRSVAFNPSPSLPFLRSSQNLSKESYSQISYTPFDDLSEEAICAIFLCLPPLEICRASVVCKSWYRFAFDSVVWKQICRERWSRYGPLEIGAPSFETEVVKSMKPTGPSFNSVIISEKFFLDIKETQSSLPPFMSEEDGPNWRKYYWYRDLQSRVWASNLFPIFTRLGPIGDAFGITEGVRLAIMNAALELVEERYDSDYTFQITDYNPLIEWILEVGTHSSEFTKLANSFFYRFASEYVPLRVSRTPINQYLFRIHSFLLSSAVDLPECFDTLTTITERFPKLVKRHQQTYKFVVESTLAIMAKYINEETVIAESADYRGTPDKEPSGIELTIDMCADCLDRITLVFMEDMYPMIKDNLIKYSQSLNWKERWTSVKAMMQICEGCSTIIRAQTDVLPRIAVELLEDENPYVQFGAISAVGQMCTDLMPTMQMKYSREIIPKLLKVMQNEANPSCQRHACSAIINLFTEIEDQYKIELKTLSSEFENKLMIQLLLLLKNSERSIQKEAVTAFASVAELLGPKLDVHFEECIQLLLGYLDHIEYSLWDCKVIEAITFLVISCSKEKTKLYINKVLDKLVEISKNIGKFPTDLKAFIVQALTRIFCKGDFEEFNPYLESILPTFYDLVSMDTSPSLNTTPTEDDQTLDINGQTFVYPAKKVELKEIAIKLLFSILEQEAAAPYAVKFFAPLLACLNATTEIKLSATLCIPLIAKRVIVKNDPTMSDFLIDVFACYKIALNNETEYETIECVVSSWKDTIENYAKNNPIVPLPPQTLENTWKVLYKMIERCAIPWEQDLDELDEEKDEQDVKEQQDSALTTLSMLESLFFAMISYFGEQAVLTLPDLVPFLKNKKVAEMHNIILCIYCGVAESVPQCTSWVLTKVTPKRLLSFANGESTQDVLQVAVFMLGVIAWKSTELFLQNFVAKDILLLLFKIFHNIEYPKNERDGFIKDNCFFSAYRIIMFCLKSAELEEMFDIMLKTTYTPCWDSKELELFYSQLIEFWESNHNIQNNTRLAQLLNHLSTIKTSVTPVINFINKVNI